MRRHCRILIPFLIALASVLASATTVQAHAVLLEAAPADGTVLERSPVALRLAFNEPVRLISLRIVDGDGRQILSGDDAHALSGTIEAKIPALPDGTYVVSYRVVSADGHPVGGALRFGIGTAGMGGAASSAPRAAVAGSHAETAWRTASAAARFALFAALVAAAGGALFLAFVIRDRREVHAAIRRYTLRAAAAAALAGISAVGIEGGLLTLPVFPAGLADLESWRRGFDSPQGGSFTLSLIGLAILGLTLRRPGVAVSRSVLAAGSVTALAGLAVTGHAATAAPRWLTTPSVLLHAVAAAVWIGALWPLYLVLRRAPQKRKPEIVQRFSTLAAVAVALLAAAGTILAAVQLRSPQALVDTAYGRILLAKLGAVVLLLGLAALNKWRLTPGLKHTGAKAAAALRLQRSITAELVLGIIILATTASLGTTPPPRALLEQSRHDAAAPSGTQGDGAARTGYAVAIPSSTGSNAVIQLSPARTGHNTITLSFSKDGAALDPGEVAVEFSLPEAGIEPLRRGPLIRTGPGTYRLDDIDLRPPGIWHMRIDALITDFEKTVFETDVPARSPGSP